MKLKKILFILIAIAIIAGMTTAIIIGKNNENKGNSKYKVVASNFASYDFLRAIIGDNKEVELTFLLGPGKDAHSYDPTAQDLVKIKEADLFVYVGGEMEKWTDKVLESIDEQGKEIVCIADFVDKIEEKEVDGAEEHEHEHEDAEDHEEAEEHEHEHEDADEHEEAGEHDHEDKEEHEHEHNHEHEEGAFDEHIWTSPANAIKMVNALESKMEKIDSANANKYKENAKNYIEKIKEVDKKIQDIVDNKVRDRLVFADKMPMQYFIEYYNLNVTAAFNGCSTETEPSAQTIANLQKRIKEEKIPVVLYIEMNPGRVAKTIAEETGSVAMQIQTLHNVSLDDFNNNETWVSLMTRNIEVLRKALQ